MRTSTVLRDRVSIKSNNIKAAKVFQSSFQFMLKICIAQMEDFQYIPRKSLTKPKYIKPGIKSKDISKFFNAFHLSIYCTQQQAIIISMFSMPTVFFSQGLVVDALNLHHQFLSRF